MEGKNSSTPLLIYKIGMGGRVDQMCIFIFLVFYVLMSHYSLLLSAPYESLHDSTYSFSLFMDALSIFQSSMHPLPSKLLKPFYYFVF